MNCKDLKDTLDIINGIVLIVGIPTAIVKYFINAKQEKEKNGYMAFDSLDREYKDYQKLCLDNPTLRIADVDSPPMTMTEYNKLSYAEQRAVKLIFTVLASTFERAYFLYNNNFGGIRLSKEIKKTQWEGWLLYMKNYKRKEVFASLWKEIGDGFDTKFLDFFNKLS